MDCNYCRHLSCTEQEQEHLKRVFGEVIPHVCIKYNQRVFHMTGAIRSINHSTRLHPCEKCLEEALADERVEISYL